MNPEGELIPLEKASHIIANLEESKTPRSRRDIAEQFSRASNLLRDGGEEEQARKVGWDSELFRLTILPAYILPLEGKSRFVAPPPSGNPWRAYFAERAEHLHTNNLNAILRAHYNDYLHETALGRERYVRGLAAAESYLAAAVLFSTEGDSADVREIDLCLDSALWFATTYKQQPIVVQIITEAVQQIQVVVTNRVRLLSHGRYAVDLIDMLLRYRRETKSGQASVDDSVVERLRDMAATSAEVLCESNRFFDAEEFLERAIAAAFLVADQEGAFQLRLRAGEARSAAADQRATGSALAAGLMLGELSEYYRKIRTDDRTPLNGKKELERREEAAKAAMLSWITVGMTELRPIVAEGELSDEEMEGRQAILDGILSLSTLNECLDAMATESELWTNVEDAITEAQSDVKKYFVASLPQVILANGMPVTEVEARDEILKLQTDRNLKMKVDFISLIFLDELFKRLREEKGLTADSLLAYFAGWRYINRDNLLLIHVGLERYFVDDYVSALHILVPQFEDVLRTFIEKATADTVSSFSAASERTVIKPRRGVRGWQYETFGDLLQRQFVRSSFPADVREYIRIVMAEQAGMNLRNDVAHGLVRPHDCTQSVLNIVLYLFIVLHVFPAREESRVDTVSNLESIDALMTTDDSDAPEIDVSNLTE